MELAQAIRERRSVRNFEPRGVETGVLRQLAEIACWAPSAGNGQTWRFVLVADESRLRKLRMVSPGIFGEPPAAIVVCQDVSQKVRQRESSRATAAPTSPGMAEYGPAMDSAMAAYAISLAAYSMGLASCIVGSFNVAGVTRLLHLPETVSPMLIVTIGHTARMPKPPQRKTEGVFFMETYDG